jgi:hypothetical protein
MPSTRPTQTTLPMWIVLGTLVVLSGILLVTGLATWGLEVPAFPR